MHSRQALLPLAALSALAIAPLHADSWQLTTADATYRAGTYASMRLDAAGEPHISHWPSTGLRYSWHDAGGWHGETVPAPALAATASARVAAPARTELLNWLQSSIALDPVGRPHIAWTHTNDVSCCGPSYTPIWYATRADTGWATEAAGPEVGEAPSLDIDAAGRPWIAYATGWIGWSTDVGIHCATRDGGVWSVTVVDSPAVAPSLRVDPAGVPHVAYAGVGGLEYATFGPGGWTHETVTSIGDSPSLAFTSAGEPRIAFLGAGSHVSYAERLQGTWTVSVADSASGTDLEPSLALGPDDQPRIAYESQGDYRPWFAGRVGGVWTRGVIDPSDDGHYPQVGVDGTGRVFVAYADNLLQVMRWAQDLQPVGVPAPAAPAALALAATSPSRVGEPLRLRLALPAAGTVSLEVFDLLGRRVASLAPRSFDAGVHVLAWPADLTRSGFFVVRARDAAGAGASAPVLVTR